MSVGPEWLRWHRVFCPELENLDRMSVGPEWLRWHEMFYRMVNITPDVFQGSKDGT